MQIIFADSHFYVMVILDFIHPNITNFSLVRC